MTIFSAGELIGLLVFVLVVVGIAIFVLRLNAAMEAPASGGELSAAGEAPPEDRAARGPQAAPAPSAPHRKRARRR